MKKNKGFTLVELLVVISIIAILLAILMPSMKKAQEQARFVVCKSNFKTYGLAFAMYLQANRDSFPHPCDCLYTTATNTALHPSCCRWHDNGVTPDGPLWPYVRDKNVSYCPTFARIARTKGQEHRNHNTTLKIPINPQFTYSMNGYLSAGNERENLMALYPDNRMPKSTNVKRPSEVLLLTEENCWTISSSVTTPYLNYRIRQNGATLNLSFWGLNDMYFMPDEFGGTLAGGQQGDCIATFHKATDSIFCNGYSSVLFVDGHVGAEKAYDSKTAANTVRRSWQLATGK
jgi:prepilin-type N-terminal cleavage/methylation domain-containing protein/prepilin-type processing-associated H-X9-DG protein